MAAFYLARYQHQKADELHRLETQASLGQGAIKSMVIVNGGAIIGVLTFIGNHGNVTSAGCVKTGLAMYALGLSLALLSYFFAYSSQAEFMYVSAYRAQDAHSRSIGAGPIDEPKQHARNGRLSLRGAIGVLLGSLVCFAVGALATLNGIL